MYELLVIGAGPHALSLLSELLPAKPCPPSRALAPSAEKDALHEQGGESSIGIECRFDDAAWWTDSSDDGHGAVKEIESRTAAVTDSVEKQAAGVDLPADWIRDRMVVIDKRACHGSGPWMPLWRKQLSFLDIKYLQSPISHHPSPAHTSHLWQHATTCRRHHGHNAIIACPHPWHPTNMGPWVRPSTALLLDFTDNVIVENLHLGTDVLQAGDVTAITPVACPCKDADSDDEGLGGLYPGLGRASKFCDHLEITLRDGRVLQARNVVLATGCSAAKQIPDWVQKLENRMYPRYCLAHCWDMAVEQEVYLKPLRANSGSKGKTVVVVGGGLASIHLSRKALDIGCDHVILLSRSALSIPPFESTATTTLQKQQRSRTRNTHQHPFPTCKMGTGVSPPTKDPTVNATCTRAAMALIQPGLRDGRMTVLEEVEITGGEWTGDDSDKGRWELYLTDGSWIVCDAVWLATGGCPDVRGEALLSQIRQQHPIKTANHLPLLQPDLSWAPHCPGLYVMGPLAAAQIGSCAHNLMGGCKAAKRIVPSLRERLRKAYRAGV
ncbi:hypothetical protein DFJ77DRAFT_479957 [Powellomyces hirtus]|nr:hypothetical protein DFJ77DRAFT_479957 [Powellomyces hirtus]